MIGLCNDPGDIVACCQHRRGYFQCQHQLVRHILRIGKIEGFRQLLGEHRRVFKLYQILRCHAVAVSARHQIGVVDILHFILEELLGSRYLAVSRHLTCSYKFAQKTQEFQQHLVGQALTVCGKVVVGPEYAFFIHRFQHRIKQLIFFSEACLIRNIKQFGAMPFQLLLRCCCGIHSKDRCKS